MENKKLEISEELLQNLTVEEIVDLKAEVDELANRLDYIIEECKESLNS